MPVIKKDVKKGKELKILIPSKLGNKFIIKAAAKTFCFDLPKDAYNNLKHEISS